MPLSAPAPREPLHRRLIDIHGYQRADGLFDIEAQLADTKSYGFATPDRPHVAPGEPLHGMWLRLTVDERLTVIACEAATDHSPYAICPEAAPNFARLAGLRIGPGFNRAVGERVGGVQGCTHLREVLAQMATVAFQTLYPVRLEREAGNPAAAAAGRNALLGTCHAYAPDSPVVRRRWPGEAAGEGSPAAAPASVPGGAPGAVAEASPGIPAVPQAAD
ncbi:DUF2889 domain-containing protein [Roseomonas sp. NAR14]|uniref:DUF2889 domain-containing protein n=1 Tax=Roseomonas acroporae TaxID=2937791 RepID=A0A9X1YFU8_9PROT|nr:DUF2889 domain-containing protein [Roseomonas acroporae]MCK8785446.1 DUF2889 domain-containing protein [Roseomonas acroporae]